MPLGAAFFLYTDFSIYSLSSLAGENQSRDCSRSWFARIRAFSLIDRGSPMSYLLIDFPQTGHFRSDWDLVELPRINFWAGFGPKNPGNPKSPKFRENRDFPGGNMPILDSLPPKNRQMKFLKKIEIFLSGKLIMSVLSIMLSLLRQLGFSITT